MRDGLDMGLRRNEKMTTGKGKDATSTPTFQGAMVMISTAFPGPAGMRKQPRTKTGLPPQN